MSSENPAKQGRSRVYPEHTLPGFKSDPVSYAAAEIAEFRRRVYDQIIDLPDEALNFVAPATQMSIGWLTGHLMIAEGIWMERISGEHIPSAISSHPGWSDTVPYGTPVGRYENAPELVNLAERLFNEYSLPLLKSISDPSQETGLPNPATVGQVLRHLSWHWVYHSGHIGLLRLQWGSEYDWKF